MDRRLCCKIDGGSSELNKFYLCFITSLTLCSAHKAVIRETKPTADAALAPHKVKMWCPGFVVHGDVAGLARRPVDWVGFQTKVNATKLEVAWFMKRVKENRWWEEYRAQKPLPARRATSSSSHLVVPTPSSSDIPPPTYEHITLPHALPWVLARSLLGLSWVARCLLGACWGLVRILLGLSGTC